MAAATGSVPGYLTAADWTTFNGKPSTAYVDNADALKVAKAGDTMSGALTVNANITSTGAVTSGQNFISSTAIAILGATGAGTAVMRPNISGIGGQFQTNDAQAALIAGSGNQPTIALYRNDGTTRVGYIQATTAPVLAIGGDSLNINILPASALFVGPRTTTVVGAARQVISYLGLGNQYGLNLVAESAAGTSYPVIFTYPPSTQVGSISATSTATAYNTSSDERLKTFTGPLTGDEAAAIIRADPARHFTWDVDGSAAVGWGAQTSYAVSSDLATPGDDLGPDAKPGDEGFMAWGTDQGKRTPYLWAALAWALDRIDSLESRVAALEAR
jgi:hypothetical protein